MTPTELANDVAETVALAQSRIKGVGASQYLDAQTGNQRFETMALDALFVYAEEELLDQINYAVMLRIRLLRLREAITAVIPGTVPIDWKRGERLLAYVRAATCPINDEPNRTAYRTAKEALQDGDLEDLPDPIW